MDGVQRKVANRVKTLVWGRFSHIRGTAARGVDTFIPSQAGWRLRAKGAYGGEVAAVTAGAYGARDVVRDKRDFEGAGDVEAARGPAAETHGGAVTVP